MAALSRRRKSRVSPAQAKPLPERGPQASSSIESAATVRREPAPAHKRGAGTAKQIAAAALRILEAEGVDAVTMHRVARELGVTPMALYYHYKNRDALLKRIVDDEILRLAAFAPSAFAAGMEEIVDRYLDYAFTRGHVFDYVFNVPRKNLMKYPRDFRARRSPSLTPVADRVAQMMEAGDLRKDDTWEVTMQLWAHAHGYVTMYRTGRFDMDEQAFRSFYHRAVRRLLRGLLAPKPE
jgi:AcrR family transcriptional regulator